MSKTLWVASYSPIIVELSQEFIRQLPFVVKNFPCSIYILARLELVCPPRASRHGFSEVLEQNCKLQTYTILHQ